MKYIFTLIIGVTTHVLFSQTATIGWYPGRTDCVDGYNVYYITGGTATSWNVTGNYRNLVVAPDKQSVMFYWNGAGVGQVSANYTGPSCPVNCVVSSPQINVSNVVVPVVDLAASSRSIAYGTTVTFTASPTNGGSTPSYSWYLNGTYVSGQSASQFKPNYLQNGDQVYVVMSSSALCASPTTDDSPTLTLSVTYSLTKPIVSNVSIPYNTSTTLTASGAGANERYRWYSARSGGTLLGEGTTFTTGTLTNHQSYHVCKYNSVTLKESERVKQDITVVLAPPPVPSLSTNTCGDKILTTVASPTNVTYYWQGVNATGTSQANPLLTYTITEALDQLFYIRARSTSGIWSIPTAINVTTDPVNLTVNSYSSPNTLIQATSSVVLKPGFNVASGKQLVARIAITPECNNTLNWSEHIVFDENEKPVVRSREYSDAVGRLLQMQSLDYATNMVWLTQPLYDASNRLVGMSLPAPVDEKDFIFKKKFMTNDAGQAYSVNDFDLPVMSGVPGEINNPKPVGKQKGTLGWYYSADNTLEPRTPITDFPYVRTNATIGPVTTSLKSSSLGDQLRMGSGHENSAQRTKVAVGELDHYFKIRNQFITTPSNYNSPLIDFDIAKEYTKFSLLGNVTVTPSGGDLERSYITVLCNQTTTTPVGVSPIGGLIDVVPGKSYSFKVRGVKSTSVVVKLYVQDQNGNNILTPGPSLPVGDLTKEKWVNTTFTVPTGVTKIKVGVLYVQGSTGDSFRISGVDLKADVPETNIGYKYSSTDENGNQKAVYVDADGKTLASVEYGVSGKDLWSYAFFNDFGQMQATVEPKGLNVNDANAIPAFVSYYKYDHLGRLIETTSPDQGLTQFVYSSDGKLRFSQNALQRAASTKRFTYTNYDVYGRKVESGEFTSKTTGAGVNYVFDPHTNFSPTAQSVLNIIDNNIPRNLNAETITSTNYTGVAKSLDGGRVSEHTFILYDKQATDLPAGLTQTNVSRAVSRVKNENTTSWYSYDEDGHILWMRQAIVGLPDHKTVDYKYNYFGLVTELAYQRGQVNEDFYHFYTYDVNQRLTYVHTSTDGTTKSLHARHLYYLHGPLKRVELSDVQGIDYTYNIDGSLKMINHSDPGYDPGSDGIGGENVAFLKDVFGMSLDFHNNDFRSAGLNAGNIALPSSYKDQFNGSLKAIRWHSASDNHVQRLYAFAYDAKDQMKTADWGTISGTLLNPVATISPTQAYQETVGSYDDNGNIASLTRKGKIGNSLANYSYTYLSNTNKLKQIETGGSVQIAYTYDQIGQVITKVEGGVTDIVTYTLTGNIKEVRNAANKLKVSFLYDDRGNRVKKTNYNSAEEIIKHTFYVNDPEGGLLSSYEQDVANSQQLKQIEIPIYGNGRIGMYKPQQATTFYEVYDHLGNVRGVIGNPQPLVFTATMEDNLQPNIQNPRVVEMNDFENLAATEYTIDASMNHSAATTAMPSPKYSSYLYWKDGFTGIEPEEKSVGPAIFLKVEPGDKLDLEVWDKYEKKSGNYSRPGITSALTSMLSNSYVGSVAGLDNLTQASQVFNNGISVVTGVAGNAGDSQSLPYAYLYYMYYDTKFNFISAGWRRVTNDGGFTAGSGSLLPHEKLSISDIEITEPGYVYVFVANESEDTRVWFDDLKITHRRSRIVSGGDYYPFGSVMENREITRENYRYGYQGQFSEQDDELGWNSFSLRNYDSRVGRWMSTDPYYESSSPYVAMGNNPISYADPTGGRIGPYSNLGYLWRAVIIGGPFTNANGFMGRSMGRSLRNASRLSLQGADAYGSLVSTSVAEAIMAVDNIEVDVVEITELTAEDENFIVSTTGFKVRVRITKNRGPFTVMSWGKYDGVATEKIEWQEEMYFSGAPGSHSQITGGGVGGAEIHSKQYNRNFKKPEVTMKVYGGKNAQVTTTHVWQYKGKYYANTYKGKTTSPEVTLREAHLRQIEEAIRPAFDAAIGKAFKRVMKGVTKKILWEKVEDIIESFEKPAKKKLGKPPKI